MSAKQLQTSKCIFFLSLQKHIPCGGWPRLVLYFLRVAGPSRAGAVQTLHCDIKHVNKGNRGMAVVELWCIGSSFFRLIFFVYFSFYFFSFLFLKCKITERLFSGHFFLNLFNIFTNPNLIMLKVCVSTKLTILLKKCCCKPLRREMPTGLRTV